MSSENCREEINDEIEKLRPDRRIEGINATVSDFWSWSYSDVMCNITRSAFGEFLVAHILSKTNRPRDVWRPYDLCYEGKRIEVKTSAYLQGWYQEKIKKTMNFDIRKRRYCWDAKTGKQIDMKVSDRFSDCYVFCAFIPEKKEGNFEILDMNNWRFFVVSTEKLNAYAKLKNGENTISFNTLKDKSWGPVGIDRLAERITQELGTISR